MKNIVMTKKLMTIALTLVLALPVMAKKTDTLNLVQNSAQTETILEVENWMTSDDYLVSEENNVAIESWMTNNSYLNEKAVKIEPWMTTLCYLKK